MAATPDLTCLDGVIGLANCACPCLEATAPEGYRTSSSGLWLADLLPLNMADAGSSCTEVGNAWNILNTARRMGLQMFMNDFRSRLGKRTTKRRETFKGRIGEDSARETLAISSTYAGLRITPAFIKGGFARIAKLGGVFNATGSMPVQIYDRFNNPISDPMALETLADKLREIELARILPLWTEGGLPAVYFLVYTVNQSNLPKAIRLWCPCGGSSLPVYNTANPYWMNNNDQRYKWTNWMGVAPWEGNTLTDFDLEAEKSVVSSTGYTNGLTMQIELTCDPTSVVCLGGLDYNSEATMAAAYAAWYACGIQGAEYLLRNNEAARSQAVTAEILAGFLKIWPKRYEENLAFATYNADLTQTDCVFCKSAYSLSIEGKQP